MCLFFTVRGQVLYLKDARKAFTEHNLWLLAQKERITMQEALVLQSKLWDSPVATIEQIVYNPEAKAWFGSKSPEQYAVSVEQLLYIGRKRNKAIELARQESKGASFQFYLLLKELDSELSQTFTELYYTNCKLKVYESSSKNIDQVIDRMELNSNQIATSELFRLKSFVADMQSTITELNERRHELQSKLRILTGLDSVAAPHIDESIIPTIDWTLQRAEDLYQTALANRTEVQIDKNNMEQARTSLELEKSQRWGSPTLGATYDRESNAVRNYWGLSLSVPLGLWNSNKGNIQAARSRIKQTELEMEQAQLLLREEVATTLAKAQELQHLYRQYAALFTPETDGLLERLLNNYAQRHIGLVEFLNHYEALQDTRIQFIDTKCRFLVQALEINRVAGTSVFSFE
ncbi:MAG: TolC family protein [Bacteroidales bacterium]|nr:TolC family protein [Bacteroidales bacterium]